MARFEVNGLDALSDDLAALAALPDSVIDELLEAEADVIVEEQRRTAREMLVGEYASGTTAASIKKGKVKKTARGRSITVSPQGSNKRGDRNAEVAYINEYGKKGQPARSFIRTANERAEQKAVEAGEKVYHDFLGQHDL